MNLVILDWAYSFFSWLFKKRVFSNFLNSFLSELLIIFKQLLNLWNDVINHKIKFFIIPLVLFALIWWKTVHFNNFNSLQEHYNIHCCHKMVLLFIKLISELFFFIHKHIKTLVLVFLIFAKWNDVVYKLICFCYLIDFCLAEWKKPFY